MKAQLYSQSGEKKQEVQLPEIFESPIREDLVQKYLESEKFILRQPYSSYEEAGKRHSASGTISHLRHTWKGHYGKGISRVPRKTMWRRGTQFFWIGAEISGSRGGRRSHPPQGIYRYRKINKKEKGLAMNSAFASTFNSALIAKRYSSLSSPVNSSIIEKLPSKTKDILALVKKIFPNFSSAREKSVRPGKGKKRGRKYKSNSGLLIITSNKEKSSFAGFDIKTLEDVKMRDLFPLGRLTLYTQQAIDELKAEAKGEKNA